MEPRNGWVESTNSVRVFRSDQLDRWITGERLEVEYGWIILLMAEILHQLIGSFPIICRVSYIPGGAGFQPSTVLHSYGGT